MEVEPWRHGRRDGRATGLAIRASQPHHGSVRVS
jgi:hypothetical protein